MPLMLSQLSGYTAAIIAFPMVNIVEITQLWDIAQARVCEVIVGILCGGMMMMILPSTSDGTALLTALKNMHARLLEHASLLWQPETTDAIRSAHEGVIGQILTMNLLRIQAFWSHYRFRRQNALLNALLHQQLRLTSVISSLRRMLLNWPTPPENSREVIEQLLAELAKTARGQLHRGADYCARYARRMNRIIVTSRSGSDYAIFASYICAAAVSYI
ncbi:fusaric acid resistance protein [Salmonella enterica subsp. enterica]|uniref:Fusaric acid resistance protein n=1 Tax=Salmonella enterica I TaxID=59201 RepID=A0A447U3V0_SALET|nr:fusaric acid resistance protein [Salmonella enterica subsp. enterica]